MEIREINDISNDFDKLNANIGLIQNYISCLSLQATSAVTTNDRMLIFHSLAYEKGFDNLNDTLENISDKINNLVNELNSIEREGDVIG